jgi:hypothetical protein
MRPFIVAFIALASAGIAAHPAHAQSKPLSRWKEIGKTSVGNSVYVDPRTVKRVNGIITARIRVKFTPPVPTPQGNWVSSQHLAMFDCAKSTEATKESIYYADEAGTKVVERKKNAMPGFGSVIGGSMTKVALDYLCATPAPRKP